MVQENMDESSPLLRTEDNSSFCVIKDSKKRTYLACASILGSEIFERMAFYGVVGNLVLFLNSNPLEWMSYNAATALFIFTGLSYMSSVFGGWIADSCIGKFKTLFLSFGIYIIGYSFLPMLTSGPHIDKNDNQTILGCSHENGNSTDKFVPLSKENCSWAVFLCLTIIGFGNGALKANIAPFGADQVKHEGPHTTRRFFNWFYWCINVGALISLGCIAYVQQQYSFFWGYITSGACLIVASLIFITGRLFYISKPAQGSVIGDIFQVLKEAAKRSKFCMKSNGSFLDSPSFSERYTDISEPLSCLDRAKVRYGGSFHDNMVDDVRAIGKILSVFAAMIPYWIVYFQMQTTFVVQGLHMTLGFTGANNTSTHDNFLIPAAWLSLFDVIFLIILLPCFDRIVYPWLDKRGYNLNLRARIILGMVFSMVAVAVAGGVETWRLSDYRRNHTHTQKIGNTNYNASDVSVLWQIPQYALIGIGEVFASVAGLELAYIEAPRSMQGIIMGLFWFCQGLGSMLGTATILVFAMGKVWFHSDDRGDINCKNCQLNYYFFFLCGLQMLGILIFGMSTKVLNIGYRATVRTSTGGHAIVQSNGNISDTERLVDHHIFRRSSRHIQRNMSSSTNST